ncbi:hypothetical protein MRY87_11935 [bacterium]|nr:hypothetical protein [bacterium]
MKDARTCTGANGLGSFFPLLFLAAHLFPILSWDWRGSDMAYCYWGILALATFSLVSGSYRYTLPTIALLFLGSTVVSLPEVPNHRLLLSFFDGAVLLSFVGRRESLGVLSSRIRLMTSATYFFATVAKLNTEFFSEQSCALVFHTHIRDFVPVIPELSARFLAFGGVVTEFLLCVLLLFSRRGAVVTGALVGIVFHTFLALDPVMRFYNFSSVMIFALVVAALPFLSAAGEGRQKRRALFPLRILLLLALCFGVGTILFMDMAYTGFLLLSRLFVIYGLLLFLLVCFGVRRACQRKESEESPGVDGTPGLKTGAFLTLLIIMGFSPYLGLKDRTSFQMYSNLRLREDGGNHLLFGRSLNLLGVLSEQVRLEDRGEEVVLPYYEFYRQEDQGSVPAGQRFMVLKSALLLEGEEYATTNDSLVVKHLKSGKEQRLPTPPYWILHRLIHFSPLEHPDRSCVW